MEERLAAELRANSALTASLSQERERSRLLEERALNAEKTLHTETSIYQKVKKAKAEEVASLSERTSTAEVLLGDAQGQLNEWKQKSLALSKRVTQLECDMQEKSVVLERVAQERDDSLAEVEGLKKELRERRIAAEEALRREEDLLAEESFAQWEKKRMELTVNNLTYQVNCLERKLKEKDEEGDRLLTDLETSLKELQLKHYHSEMEIAHLKLELVNRSHSMYS